MSSPLPPSSPVHEITPSPPYKPQELDDDDDLFAFEFTSPTAPQRLVSSSDFEDHVPLAQLALRRAHRGPSPDSSPHAISTPTRSRGRQQKQQSNYNPRSSSMPPPIQSSPSVAPLTPLKIMASDDSVMYSPRTERKYKTQQSQSRRRQTLTAQRQQDAAILSAKKTAVFSSILSELDKEGYSLAEFLDHVFNPQTDLSRDWRYRGFFAHKQTVTRILDYWVSSGYPESTRSLLRSWALQLTSENVYQESKRITLSGLLSIGNKVVNEAFFLDYNLVDLVKKLKGMAPTLFSVLGSAASGPRRSQHLKLTKESIQRKATLIGAAALGLFKAASQRNTYAQAVHGTYLMATGAQRQHFGVLSSLGITMSYSSVINRSKGDQSDVKEHTDKGKTVETVKDPKTVEPAPEASVYIPTDKRSKRERKRTAGTLYKLSNACRATARRIAATMVFIMVYDNINMMIRVAEQVLGRKDAQENGTCATIFPLHNTQLDDLRLDRLEESIANAPQLTVDHLNLTPDEAELHLRAIRYTILRIIIYNGGDSFTKWKKKLNETQPMSGDVIDVHTTSVHPSPAMEIDESRTTGNIDVVEFVMDELQVDREEAERYIFLIGGDQLSLARQRSILIARLGHEAGHESWKRIVLVPGLFHAKMADCHGVLATHFGKANAGGRSPGGLAFQNQCLDRLPIVLTSLPTFRTCRDIIMVSLNARVLHCLLLVSGHKTLDEYLSKVTTFEALDNHAGQILSQFTDTELVTELREKRAPEERRRAAETKEKKESKSAEPLPHVKAGDMVYENAILFMRDALLTREFADAIKCGDSGRVVIVLKQWAFAYRGHGRTKYAHEMLHLIHNLTNVWPEEIKNAVLQNWLLCPLGRPFSFVELDLVQEHLNYWVKRVYKADGNAHSWEWLEMVSPCIDVLRRLATRIHSDLGSAQGTKHATPDVSKDIAVLMDKLAEHQVYEYLEGRVFDDDEQPAPDAISVGYVALAQNPKASSNPINEFNAQFERIKSRLDMTPITTLLQQHESGTLIPPVVFPPRFDSTMPSTPTASEEDLSAQEEEEESFEADGDLFADSPTLQCIDEGDVALDMDHIELLDLTVDDGMDDDADEEERW